MSVLIKNGCVVDPATGLNKVQDILLKNSKISKVANEITDKAEQVIDARNKIVIPGIVDMHVHLREPGREDKETVKSGTRAALKGGVTTVLAMPNTHPAIDSVEKVKLLKNIIKNSAEVNVCIAAAITRGRLGKKISPISGLKKEGIVAITDDGGSVDDEKLFLKALKEANDKKVLTICHCEDKVLSGGGVMNLGFTSTILGLRGASRESEYKRVERDIELAKKAKAHIHIAHVSCKESVDLISGAKKKGVRVSAETAPHYFSLDETALSEYNTNMKINPPLREKADVDAIKKGLKSGVLDAIASDHAPHTDNEKDIEFDRAEFGTIGLETTLAVSITELVKPGLFNWLQLAEKLSYNPAKLLDIDRGKLKEGSIADIVVIDPDSEWIVKREDFSSKSKNSCFIGRKLYGRVDYTIFAGRVVYKR